MLLRNVTLGMVAALVIFSSACANAIPVEQTYVDAVVSFELGADPDPWGEYADPNSAVGAPDGNWTSLGKDSELVLEFTDNYAVDGSGADLVVMEFSSADQDFIEAQVSVSADGSNWYTYSNSINSTGYFDLSESGLSQIAFVKIEGLKEDGDTARTTGFDLAYVRALNAIERQSVDLGGGRIIKKKKRLVLLGGGIVAIYSVGRGRS